MYPVFWQSTEHQDTLGGKCLHSWINKQVQQSQIFRKMGKKLVHVVKKIKTDQTQHRGLAKVTARPKRDSCNVYLGKSVCPHHEQKVKHSCHVFTWISKTTITQ